VPENLASTLTAKNLSRARWQDRQGRTCGFQSNRAYGVVDPDGRMLSKDGDTPMTWGTLKTAKVIAEYPPSWAKWVMSSELNEAPTEVD
jgi:hypothetical protein